MTVRAVTMRCEFTGSYRRLMKMKINDPQGRNQHATAGRTHRGGPSQHVVEHCYYFLSIFVMVSPDWVKET